MIWRRPAVRRVLKGLLLGRRRAIALVAANAAGLGAPVLGWTTDLPALLEPPPPVSDCVRRYGHTGCAARLYAQLLCEIVGQTPDLDQAQRRLQQRYSDEQIDFAGIAIEQVEATAVRYYVPQVCSPKQEEIWNLLLPQEAG